MPTKPVTVFTHATDATFSSGPASGLDTKLAPVSPAQGFISGTGIDAPAMNYLLHIVGSWLTDWIIQGSNANDPDAHIVETDANGQINVARGLFSNVSGVTPLRSEAVGAQVAARFNGSGSGSTLEVVTDQAVGVNVNAVAGGGPATGISVEVDADTGPGIIVTHNGAGNAISCSNPGGGFAAPVLAETFSAASALEGRGATTIGSPGVYGFAQHEDGNGVVGQTASDGTPNVAGVYALGSGLTGANGLIAQSATGYAARLEVSGNTQAPLFMTPQSADPGLENGAIALVSQAATGLTGANFLRIGHPSQWRYVSVYRTRKVEPAYATNTSVPTVATGTDQIVETANFGQTLGGPGTYLYVDARLMLSVDVTTNEAQITIESDDGAGGSKTVHHTQNVIVPATANPASDATASFSYLARVTPTNLSNRRYLIRVTHASGSQTLRVHGICLRIEGEHNANPI